MYCEDSVADEVEHFRPKDLYPDAVFAWRNYLYACGPCNGGKSNRFSVAEPGTGQLVDDTRRRRARVTPPREGAAALIDPRHENPLDFLIFDLPDTFEFTPFADTETVEFRRADYTIDLLRLNDRGYLMEARKNARVAYEALLERYVTLTQDGASHRQVARVKKCIQGTPHPTVWAEIEASTRSSRFVGQVVPRGSGGARFLSTPGGAASVGAGRGALTAAAGTSTAEG